MQRFLLGGVSLVHRSFNMGRVIQLSRDLVYTFSCLLEINGDKCLPYKAQRVSAVFHLLVANSSFYTRRI
uniref:Uncharacterized protein n=1 Tax=Magallana gigas TaxID=29159 RepID=K1PU76_MAGGI